MLFSPQRRLARSRVAVAGAVASVFAVTAAVTVPPLLSDAAAAPAAPSAEAHAAIDWLGTQLDNHHGSMPASFGEGSDWGLTADVILAFASAGRSTDAAAQRALDRLTENAVVYTTWDDIMPDAHVRVAGPTAKMLLALTAGGRSSVVEGVDFEAELRGLVTTSGIQRGRVSDRVPNPAWNAANGFGQALAILALETTPGRSPDSAVQFLIAQQCPAGGFRLNYSTTAACANDAEADTDASGLALSALLAVERTPEVSASLTRGTAWLLGKQQGDGSFGGTGPAAAANTNSTGITAQFLRAAGHLQAADRAAVWITGCCTVTTATAAGTALVSQLGAIAYSPAAFAAGTADGITTQSGDQWRRSTTQAVLALGLAPYGRVDVTPIVDSPTSSTAAPTTSSSTTASSTTSTSSTTASSTTSTSASSATSTSSSTTEATTTTAATTSTTSTPTTSSVPTSVLGQQLSRNEPPAATSGSTFGSNRASSGTDGAGGASRLATTGSNVAGLLSLAAGTILLGTAVLSRRPKVAR